MDERIYCKLHVLHAYQPRGQKGDEPQINNKKGAKSHSKKNQTRLVLAFLVLANFRLIRQRWSSLTI